MSVAVRDGVHFSRDLRTFVTIKSPIVFFDRLFDTKVLSFVLFQFNSYERKCIHVIFEIFDRMFTPKSTSYINIQTNVSNVHKSKHIRNIRIPIPYS